MAIGRGGALVDAQVFTMAGARRPEDGDAPPDGGPSPWRRVAEAMLWEGDRIVAVGSSAAIRREAERRGLPIESMEGRVVLPGFVDAHMHFIHAGMKRLRPDLRGAASLEDALQRVAEWLHAHPGTEAVTGEGWDESGWPVQRWPSRDELDEACRRAGQPERALVLRRIDGHIAVANSAAITLVRRRWDDDRLVDMSTGVLLEDASLYLNEALPAAPGTIDVALQEACRIAHFLGVTTLGDYSQAPFRAALLRAAHAGTLGVRVASSVYVQQLEAELATGFRTGRPAPGPGGEPSNFLRDGGLKVFLDGSLGAHTAALRHGYVDEEGQRGHLNWSDEQVRAWVARAEAAGIQVHAHAIGDAAIDQGLEAFASVLDGPEAEPRGAAEAGVAPGIALGVAPGTGLGVAPGAAPEAALGVAKVSARATAGGAAEGVGRNSLRHRFEHFEIVHDDQLGRTARLGVVASSQPNFVGEWSAKGGMYEARLGPRYRLNNRFRAMKERGVPLAFGSDGMPFGPLVGLDAAVHHPEAAQRLEAMEAVWHYTWMAGWSLHWEADVGSLEPGKFADYLVLDAPPSQRPREWSVTRTMTGGRIVYEANA